MNRYVDNIGASFVIVIIDSINQLAVQLRGEHTFTYKHCNLTPKLHHSYYFTIQIICSEFIFWFCFFHKWNYLLSHNGIISVEVMEQVQFSIIMKWIFQETILLINITSTALSNVKRLAKTSKPFILNVKAVLLRSVGLRSGNRFQNEKNHDDSCDVIQYSELCL